MNNNRQIRCQHGPRAWYIVLCMGRQAMRCQVSQALPLQPVMVAPTAAAVAAAAGTALLLLCKSSTLLRSQACIVLLATGRD